MKEGTSRVVRADMQTAQNRMFTFVEKELQKKEDSGEIDFLLRNPNRVPILYSEVQQQLFTLFDIPASCHQQWHFGIADSGKRTIELLVNCLCPPQAEANIAVNTENYVAFNKFSAVTAIQKQKNIAFSLPFSLEMGTSLTINAEEEFRRAKFLLENPRTKTVWIAWNSTSTGIKENADQLVAHRNQCGSKTIIVADAASLPLFTNSWKILDTKNLPDVFFFSLRKQGLPYDGPQDEANQAKNSGSLVVFNDRALERARELGCSPLYDSPTLDQSAKYEITSGDQRRNHIKHLVKLRTALEVFLEEGGRKLDEQDAVRASIHREILQAFNGGELGNKHFSLLAEPEAQSETAYIVKLPPEASPSKTIARLKEQGVYISVSMHPRVSNKHYLRFACYPANTVEETRMVLKGFAEAAD